jgi:VIT1/CCC1 family predicted Fe2+/Mn2+ transporter
MAAVSSASNDDVARQDGLRDRIVDANDGIIATAGIIEGFVGAGAGDVTVALAALVAMIAGGLALGAVKYTEAAMERDEYRSILESERARLVAHPEAERAELADLYRAKGLSDRLAEEVAAELSERDALASQLDAEYGLTLGDEPRPIRTAAQACGAFVVGAAVPVAAALLSPDPVRAAITLAAVIVALIVTSVIVARSQRTRPLRIVLRTVFIGVLVAGASLGGGELFHG